MESFTRCLYNNLGSRAQQRGQAMCNQDKLQHSFPGTYLRRDGLPDAGERPFPPSQPTQPVCILRHHSHCDRVF